MAAKLMVHASVAPMRSVTAGGTISKKAGKDSAVLTTSRGFQPMPSRLIGSTGSDRFADEAIPARRWRRERHRFDVGSGPGHIMEALLEDPTRWGAGHERRYRGSRRHRDRGRLRSCDRPVVVDRRRDRPRCRGWDDCREARPRTGRRRRRRRPLTPPTPQPPSGWRPNPDRQQTGPPRAHQSAGGPIASPTARASDDVSPHHSWAATACRRPVGRCVVTAGAETSGGSG